MAYPVMPLGFLGSQGDNDAYRVERSLRFNSADTAYLSRTPASAGNRKTWTLSAWAKRSSIGSALSNYIIGNAQAPSGTNGVYFGFGADTLFFGDYGASGWDWYVQSSSLYRDVSAWYHVVAQYDTTQATASERIKLYVNGVRLTAFDGASTYPTLNVDGRFNQASVEMAIGRLGTYNGNYFNGYMTEINFIDGQALTPSSFGETDAITGRWKAKAYSGTYGTNGFYLKFADNSGTTSTTLGKDSSPNGNNWTPNNFSVTAGTGNDSLVDSPTNYGSDSGVGGEVRGNYCTLSAIDFAAGSSGFTLTDGNLRYSKSVDSGNSRIRGNIFIGSGKYYWEYNIGSVGAAGLLIGIASLDYKIGTTNDTFHRSYLNTGNKISGATSTSYGSSYTANDVIGLAVDVGAGTIVFYKNGTSQGTAFTDIAGSQWTSFIQGEGVINLNFGQRPFAYTAPTGFKALCTTNLPTPTINKPSSYFDAVTFTATGADQTITGFNFSPNFVWIKNRANWAGNRHTLFDTTRGIQQRLDSSTTEAEAADNDLFAFNSNGFSGNLSGTTYVAWAWEAGSSNATNNSGSITSTVRANPQAGVSIVSFVNASGTNQSTVGHGLGSSPKMIIAKNRDTSANNWAVFHSSVCDTTSKFLQLNTTAALTTFATVWGASLPSSSVFGVTGGGIAAASVNMIAYCFAEIEGFSKFGSYTGNGSADGPFVYCGFRPRWVMIKTSNATNSWIIIDSSRDAYNSQGNFLLPNTSGAEGSVTPAIDLVSNGFKMRLSNAGWNGSGETIIFAAFAESPFKYARAR